MLTRTATGAGLAFASVLLLRAAPAMAQVEARSHEAHVYAGQLFGDDLTDTTVSGQTPEIDDDAVYGLRYGYNFSETWGIETSLSFNPNSVTGLAGGDIDIDLSTIDINAMWHINPQSRFVPYLTAGVGYAQADLDRPIEGTVDGQPVSIGDDSGFTLNAGGGAKYFVNDRFMIRLDARYRYMDKVVDRFSESPGIIETTLGVGWRF